MLADVEEALQELGVCATLPLSVKMLEDILQYLQLREVQL